jgi:indole-3-glycerol phosphate synthase
MTFRRRDFAQDGPAYTNGSPGPSGDIEPSNILAAIAARKRQEVRAAKNSIAIGPLARLAESAPPPLGFMNHLQKSFDVAGVALIAEIKQASPSKGTIRDDFNPAALAQAYARGGACCLSVLTDETYFRGHADHLRQVKQTSTLPVLRKDFIVDPYQVYEARAWGADCILMIMALLGDQEAREIKATADSLKMDVIIEVHTDLQLRRALTFQPLAIGINNRDLRTFEVDLSVTEALGPQVPAGCIAIAESGIKHAADLAGFRKCGVRAYLVGEALLAQADVASATRALLNVVSDSH